MPFESPAPACLRAATEGLPVALSLPIHPAVHGSLPEPTAEEAAHETMDAIAERVRGM